MALDHNDPLIAGYGYTLLPFNYVPSYFLFNFNATYNFENISGLQGLATLVQVNNVFNRKPPFASSPVDSTRRTPERIRRTSIRWVSGRAAVFG